jgi:hypothetical protein
MSEIEFTSAGAELKKHLQRLFDVPKVNPIDLTSEGVASLIMVILLAGPIGNQSNNLPKATDSGNRALELLKERQHEITAIAARLKTSGWLVSFSWEYDSDSNPIRFNVDFTEIGKSKLRTIYSAWKKSGAESMGDWDTNNIPFVGELGHPITPDDLEALSVFAAVCYYPP